MIPIAGTRSPSWAQIVRPPVCNEPQTPEPPDLVVRPADYPDRTAWSAALADLLADFTVDWVVSAGFMRILDATFLDKFPQRVVNSHPALLPAFPGAHAVADALAYGVKVTGCTVHLVDSGWTPGRSSLSAR